MIIRWWIYLTALNVRWLIGRIGYVIRPYDMLADRRRWFWQPRTSCGCTWFREQYEQGKLIRLDIEER